MYEALELEFEQEKERFNELTLKYSIEVKKLEANLHDTLVEKEAVKKLNREIKVIFQTKMHHFSFKLEDLESHLVESEAKREELANFFFEMKSSLELKIEQLQKQVECGDNENLELKEDMNELIENLKVAHINDNDREKSDLQLEVIHLQDKLTNRERECTVHREELDQLRAHLAQKEVDLDKKRAKAKSARLELRSLQIILSLLNERSERAEMAREDLGSLIIGLEYSLKQARKTIKTQSIEIENDGYLLQILRDTEDKLRLSIDRFMVQLGDAESQLEDRDRTLTDGRRSNGTLIMKLKFLEEKYRIKQRKHQKSKVQRTMLITLLEQRGMEAQDYASNLLQLGGLITSLRQEFEKKSDELQEAEAKLAEFQRLHEIDRSKIEHVEIHAADIYSSFVIIDKGYYEALTHVGDLKAKVRELEAELSKAKAKIYEVEEAYNNANLLAERRGVTMGDYEASISNLENGIVERQDEIHRLEAVSLQFEKIKGLKLEYRQQSESLGKLKQVFQRSMMIVADLESQDLSASQQSANQMNTLQRELAYYRNRCSDLKNELALTLKSQVKRENISSMQVEDLRGLLLAYSELREQLAMKLTFSQVRNSDLEALLMRENENFSKLQGFVDSLRSNLQKSKESLKVKEMELHKSLMKNEDLLEVLRRRELEVQRQGLYLEDTLESLDIKIEACAALKREVSSLTFGAKKLRAAKDKLMQKTVEQEGRIVVLDSDLQESKAQEARLEAEKSQLAEEVGSLELACSRLGLSNEDCLSTLLKLTLLLETERAEKSKLMKDNEGLEGEKAILIEVIEDLKNQTNKDLNQLLIDNGNLKRTVEKLLTELTRVGLSSEDLIAFILKLNVELSESATEKGKLKALIEAAREDKARLEASLKEQFEVAERQEQLIESKSMLVQDYEERSCSTEQKYEKSQLSAEDLIGQLDQLNHRQQLLEADKAELAHENQQLRDEIERLQMESTEVIIVNQKHQADQQAERPDSDSNEQLKMMIEDALSANARQELSSQSLIFQLKLQIEMNGKLYLQKERELQSSYELIYNRLEQSLAELSSKENKFLKFKMILEDYAEHLRNREASVEELTEANQAGKVAYELLGARMKMLVEDYLAQISSKTEKLILMSSQFEETEGMLGTLAIDSATASIKVRELEEANVVLTCMKDQLQADLTVKTDEVVKLESSVSQLSVRISELINKNAKLVRSLGNLGLHRADLESALLRMNEIKDNLEVQLLILQGKLELFERRGVGKEELEQLVDELEAKISELEAQIRELQNENRGLLQKVTSLERDNTVLYDRVGELEAAEELNLLIADRSTMEREDLEQKLAQKNEIAKRMADEISLLNTRLEDVEGELEETKTLLDETEAKYSAAQKYASAMELREAKAHKETVELLKQRDEYKQKIAVLETERAELQLRVSEAEAQLAEHLALIEAMKLEAERVQLYLNRNMMVVEDLVGTLENSAQARTELSTSLASKLRIICELEIQVSMLNAKVDSLTNELEDLKKDRSELQRSRYEIEHLRSSQNDLKSKLSESEMMRHSIASTATELRSQFDELISERSRGPEEIIIECRGSGMLTPFVTPQKVKHINRKASEATLAPIFEELEQAKLMYEDLLQCLVNKDLKHAQEMKSEQENSIAVQGRLRMSIQDLIVQIEVKQAFINTREAYVQKLSKEVSKRGVFIKKLEEELRELRLKATSYAKLEVDNASLIKRTKELEEELKAQKKKVQELLRQIADMESLYADHIGKAESETAQLAEQLEEESTRAHEFACKLETVEVSYTGEVERLMMARQELRQLIESYEASMDDYEVRMNQLNKKLKQVSGHVQLSKKRIEDLAKEKKIVEDLLAERDRQLKTLKSDLQHNDYEYVKDKAELTHKYEEIRKLYEQLADENAQLENRREQLEEALELLNEEMLRQKAELLEKEKSLSRLTSSSSELQRAGRDKEHELSSLRLRLREATDLNTQLLNDKEDLQEALEEVEAEAELMRSELNARASMLEALKRLEDESQQLRKEAEDRNQQLLVCKTKLQAVRRELSKRKKAYLLKGLVHIYKQRYSLKLAYGYYRLLWNAPGFDIALSTDFRNFDNLQAGELTDPEMEEGQKMLTRAKTALLIENPIRLTYESAGLNEAPLAYANVFKFFEELMDRKYEIDQADIAARREPRSMAEFMLEHLNRRFGLKKLEIKFLCQLMPALQLLYREEQAYGILFCRLLQVYHPDPVPFELAVVLTRVRIEFCKLMERTNKGREDRDTKRGLKQTSKKHQSMLAYELQANGGEVFLADILDLVYRWFGSDSEVGEMFIELLKPSSISQADFVTFLICQRMVTMGKDPSNIFDLLAQDSSELTLDRFITGLRQSLDLWVSVDSIALVFDLIDTDASSGITKDEFSLKIGFDQYYFRARSDDYVVTKCCFLNAFVEAYRVLQTRQAARLLRVFYEFSAGSMNLSQFRKVLQIVDPELTMNGIDHLYNKGIGMSNAPQDGLDREAFCGILLKYSIGFKSVFSVLNLESANKRRKQLAPDIKITSEGRVLSPPKRGSVSKSSEFKSLKLSGELTPSLQLTPRQ